jgi:predicted alpha/beta-hydrolase family hydrolase
VAKTTKSAPRMGAQYTRAPRVRRRAALIPVDQTTKVHASLTLPPEGASGPLETAIVFGHGAGGTMDQALNVQFADALAERGALVLRFNFAYADAGRRAPDRPPVLVATVRAVAAWLLEQPEARGRTLVLGGKSMGGRIASHLAAQGDRCDGLLFLGYPLHPAGRPKQMRDAHLADAPCPMLFLEGTRDPLCDLSLLRPVLERLGPRATLQVIEGGDHSFKVPKKTGRSEADVLAELVEASARWLAGLKPMAARPAAATPPKPSRAPSSATPRAGTRTRGSRSAPRT